MNRHHYASEFQKCGPFRRTCATRSPILGGGIFLIALLLLVMLSTSNLMSHLRRGGTRDGLYHGRYPNSLLTLFYPYTLLRDVVLDQPIDSSDVPFFWHVHKSDEIIMKQVLTDCYGLELIELDSTEAIERAKQQQALVHLASSQQGGKNFVVTSPFLRDAIQIFSQQNFGRMFCFFRHPLDYDVHDDLPTFAEEDNWLTRLLSDVHEGHIGFQQLAVAKHVVRETCVVGTLDKMAESIQRIVAYYGWEPITTTAGSSGGDVCIQNIVRAHNPQERWVDHRSQGWFDFYEKNRFDCQLYELAQSTWRAQIQTIIPYELQLSRANPVAGSSESDD